MTDQDSNEKSDGIWLRTDEMDEFIGSLEFCGELSETVHADKMRWKWLILALHNTLQGVCVCALRGRDTAGISMLEKKSAAAMRNWLDVDSRKQPPPPAPDEKLANMLDLFKRVKNNNYLPDPHRLPSHDQMNQDVKKLNRLRNDFSHFVPKSFSLEVSGMPRIVGHCCDVIEHLTVKHPTGWKFNDEICQARIKKALASLRGSMDAWTKGCQVEGEC